MRFWNFFINTLILDAGTKKHNFFSHYWRSLNFCRYHSEGIEKTTPGCDLLFQFSHWKVKTNAEVLKSSNTFLFLHTYSHTVWVSWLCIYYCLPQKPKGPTCIVLTPAVLITNWKNNVCDERCIVTQQRVGKTPTLPNFDAPPEVMSCHINLENVSWMALLFN